MRHLNQFVGTTVIAFLLFGSCGIYADLTDEWIEKAEELSETHAIVNFGYVGTPLGKILLVKNGNDICALRIVGFHRKKNSTQKQTLFYSGGDEYHVEYEWYYPIDGVAGFDSQKKMYSGHGHLYRKPTYGIGRFVLPSLHAPIFECGEITGIAWHYPAYVPMYSGSNRNNSILLAPTGWEKISEVNMNDDKLVWYGYDDSRDTIYIPISDLSAH